MTHGIPTSYHGIEYRSRLEARWAGLSECWAHDILILGADPLPGLDNSLASNASHPAAGLLGQRSAHYEPTLDGVLIEFDSWCS